MSQYTVRIYDRLFNPVTTFTNTNVFDLEYSNEVNKPGSASFKIKVRDPKATTTNLKLFNRIKIYKGTLFKFVGYIETLNVSLNTIEVNCVGMFQVLKNRNIAYQTTPSVTLTYEFYYILNNLINASDDTGINEGTSTSSYFLNNRITFRDNDALSVLQKMAALDNKVININENHELDLIDSPGSDKSDSIILNYDINQIATANIFEYNVEVDGGDMANVVIGKTKSIVTVQQDPTSIALFGKLEERKNFGESETLQQLEDEAKTYLDIHKNEFIVPKIKPNSLKLDPDSYDIGDTVRVNLDNGFLALNAKYLITKKKVRVSNSGIDDVDIDLVQEGANVLPSNFLNEIADVDKRLTITEGIVLE